MQRELDHYVTRFAKLRTDRSNPWGAKTRHQAPHKALLLFSVLDHFETGEITSNLIELTPDLGELFDIYWSLVKPMDREHGNVATPFFHLRNERFWHLLPRPGQELFIKQSTTIQSVTKLRETTFGARLDDALYDLLCTGEGRETLRQALLDTYFAPELQGHLLAQAVVNARAVRYAEELLQHASGELHEISPAYAAEAPVRDQGFRRAIVRAYDRRCTLCGVRILTADGHTAIAAAHIIPWSQSHDDDPRNGMALCHLCHWTFDEGLFGVGDDYQIQTSSELAANENLPGHLHTLGGRPLIGPAQRQLWPFPRALRWHNTHTFRR